LLHPAAHYSLQDLDLSHNPRLEGKLPEYWGRLTNLKRMDLSNCGLSGLLPVTWVALQNVASINLSNNILGGEPFSAARVCFGLGML
jgi:Leucine-rich repeat (LRR) protein